jgi:hypothetical protein
LPKVLNPDGRIDEYHQAAGRRRGILASLG